MVCEDLSHNGSFAFVGGADHGNVILAKRVYAQHPPETSWSTSGPHDAVKQLLEQDPSGHALSGAPLTANGTRDPDFDAVFALAPPIRASQVVSTPVHLIMSCGPY